MTIDLSNIYRFVYTKKKRKIFFINNNGNMMNVLVLYLLTVKKEIKKWKMEMK